MYEVWLAPTYLNQILNFSLVKWYHATMVARYVKYLTFQFSSAEF